MITNKGRKKGGDSLIIACKAFLFLILLQHRRQILFRQFGQLLQEVVLAQHLRRERAEDFFQRLIPRVCGEAPHVLFRGGKVTVLEKALEKSIVDMNFLS